jgi:hypothetical protein
MSHTVSGAIKITAAVTSVMLVFRSDLFTVFRVITPIVKTILFAFVYVPVILATSRKGHHTNQNK